MTCKGLIGVIFGHKYHSKIVEYIPSEFPNREIEIRTHGCGLEEFMNARATKRYKIVCIRCGKELPK
jgi:hypothetical protein